MNARVILCASMSVMVAAGSVAATETQNDPLWAGDADLPRRSLSAIQLDVREALRAEALSRRRGPNAAEVIRLVDLYRELAAHPKRDDSALVKELGWKLRSRLERVRDRIEEQSRRRDRREKQKDVVPTLVTPEADVLTQQMAVPGGAAAGQGAQPAAAQPGGAPTIDYGPELVDLIQWTISPATWDINGGNGSVVYFAPLRVIVVSAPGTVHDQVGGVLGQLRAAP
jgi:hypothetical protein